ncbi:hypothetical protein H0H93_008600 [Arthromyces matolae]|nr:hypothetical protein H0H93_008600 [Arthromyces matolae]
MSVHTADTKPQHWRYVSEGGATIVFSYIGPSNSQFDGTVLRLRKAPVASQSTTSIDAENEPDDPMIVFQKKCMERLIPPEHLPHLESVYVSREWLESLISLHDSERPLDRRAKDQVDLSKTKGVLATDLVGGDWISVEIKPKWGFLPSPTHLSNATRNIKTQTCRFCMHSAMKSNMGETVSLGYCPLDLFSGDKNRVLKAIHDLWDAWIESNGTINNLKIFVHGKRIGPSNASLMLSDDSREGTTSDGLCDVFSDALLPVLLETPVLRILSTLQRSLDSLDIEGLFQLWRLVESEFTHKSTDKADVVAPLPSQTPGSPSLFSSEPDITDWTQFLDIFSSTELNHSHPASEHLRFYLLAYLLSATFKDCSLIVRLDHLRPHVLSPKVKPEQIMIIDLDPKSMSRLRKWEKLDQEIVQAYCAGGVRKVLRVDQPDEGPRACPFNVGSTLINAVNQKQFGKSTIIGVSVRQTQQPAERKPVQ